MRFQTLGKILNGVRTESNIKARISQRVCGGSPSLYIAPGSDPSSGRFTAAVSGMQRRSSDTQRGRTFRAVEAGGDRGRANLVSGFGFRASGSALRVAGCGLRVSGFGGWVLGFGFQVSAQVDGLMHLPLRCSRSLIVQMPSPFATTPVLPTAQMLTEGIDRCSTR